MSEREIVSTSSASHFTVDSAVVRALQHLDQAAVGGAAAAAGDRLGDDGRGGVRRGVHHLGAGVLVLALAGHRDREHLALGVLADHPDRRVLHRDLGADVAVDPLHGRALVATARLVTRL